jgi:hypothetical protein
MTKDSQGFCGYMDPETENCSMVPELEDEIKRLRQRMFAHRDVPPACRQACDSPRARDRIGIVDDCHTSCPWVNGNRCDIDNWEIPT